MSREGDIKVLMNLFEIDEDVAANMVDKNALNMNFIKNGITATLDDRFSEIKDGLKKNLEKIMDDLDLDVKQK